MAELPFLSCGVLKGEGIFNEDNKSFTPASSHKGFNSYRVRNYRHERNSLHESYSPLYTYITIVKLKVVHLEYSS